MYYLNTLNHDILKSSDTLKSSTAFYGGFLTLIWVAGGNFTPLLVFP